LCHETYNTENIQTIVNTVAGYTLYEFNEDAKPSCLSMSFKSKTKQKLFCAGKNWEDYSNKWETKFSPWIEECCNCVVGFSFFL